MAQYIDKDTLVAEIKRRQKEHDEKKYDYASSDHFWASVEDGNILSIIDTLEVKEVDIEDSIKETLSQKYIDYTFRRHNIDPESKEGQLIYYAYMHGMNQCLTQLRTQKGK